MSRDAPPFPHAPQCGHDHIPIDEQIQSYCQCQLCWEELPEGQSMRNYARLNVGLTPIGLQVMCVRHNANVLHIDLQGVSHPANSCREPSAAFDTFDVGGKDSPAMSVWSVARAADEVAMLCLNDALPGVDVRDVDRLLEAVADIEGSLEGYRHQEKE